MSHTWKTVRIFISSTFRDMHAEREHSAKAAFTRLRQRCEYKRLDLADIDLRTFLLVLLDAGIRGLL